MAKLVLVAGMALSFAIGSLAAAELPVTSGLTLTASARF